MRFAINPMQFYAQPDGTHDFASGPGPERVAERLRLHGFAAVQADLRAQTVAEATPGALPPAPGYLSAHLESPEAFGATLVAYEAAARRSRELGLKDMVVACALTVDGRARAGQRAHEPLDRPAITEIARQLDAVGRVTAEQGVRTYFHPHVGSPIETPVEIISLLDATDPDVVMLCPDTGHLAWGGVDDVEAFLERVAPRVGMLHVKDVDAKVIDEGRQLGWDYAGFVRRGVWREPGMGDLGLLPMLRPWSAHNLWCVIEVDVAATETVEESLAACARFVQAMSS